MAKLLLHYRTTLGPRTIIAEIADKETASAVMNAHLALGEQASICDESTRISMKDHLARWKETKALPKPVEVPAPNVTNIRRPRKP